MKDLAESTTSIQKLQAEMSIQVKIASRKLE